MARAAELAAGAPRRLRRLVGAAGALGLLCALAAGALGCAVPLQQACPGCPRLALGERPPVPPGTRTLFVLVPGLLGYGWEWNGAQLALGQLPATSVLVYEWDAWASLLASSDRLTAHARFLLRRLPASVRKVIFLGHSAAGMLVVRAAAGLQPPPGVRLEVLAVGAPLAGCGINPWGGDNLLRTALPIALAGRFTAWPEPAQGVRLRIFPTGPRDPVMRRYFGHDPGDPSVLPPGAELVPLPRELDHNVALGQVARRLVAEEIAEERATPPAATPKPADPATSPPPQD